MTVSWLDITLPAVTLDWCPYIPQYMYMYIYCFLGLRNCCWHSNILCVNSCVTVCNSIISGVLSKVGRDLVFINHQYTVTNFTHGFQRKERVQATVKTNFVWFTPNNSAFICFMHELFTLYTIFLWPRVLCFETIELT